jgi:hypothetical protein
MASAGYGLVDDGAIGVAAGRIAPTAPTSR